MYAVKSVENAITTTTIIVGQTEIEPPTITKDFWSGSQIGHKQQQNRTHLHVYGFVTRLSYLQTCFFFHKQEMI